MVGKH